jgi:hypothetical protein
MTIVNIRGTSGSGKSTLVHKLLAEYPFVAVEHQFPSMKKPKIVGYVHEGKDELPRTFIVGSYKTQCGGCDSMSYKGSHDDMELLVRQMGKQGNVVFEGLTISSTLTRWKRIDDEYGDFVWAFMMTPEEECHRRILARNGGREPKRNAKGLADYQIKYRGCMSHIGQLREENRTVVELDSDDVSYERFKELLIAPTPAQ